MSEPAVEVISSLKPAELELLFRAWPMAITSGPDSRVKEFVDIAAGSGNVEALRAAKRAVTIGPENLSGHALEWIRSAPVASLEWALSGHQGHLLQGDIAAALPGLPAKNTQEQRAFSQGVAPLLAARFLWDRETLELLLLETLRTLDRATLAFAHEEDEGEGGSCRYGLEFVDSNYMANPRVMPMTKLYLRALPESERPWWLKGTPKEIKARKMCWSAPNKAERKTASTVDLCLQDLAWFSWGYRKAHGREALLKLYERRVPLVDPGVCAAGRISADAPLEAYEDRGKHLPHDPTERFRKIRWPDQADASASQH
jgi:hypothetical protein